MILKYKLSGYQTTEERQFIHTYQGYQKIILRLKGHLKPRHK